MKPGLLKLTNFQSFRGEHDIPLGAIRCAAVLGLNGSGKSSIFDAIRFCVWGYSRVPRDLNWVITQGEQVCRVEFEFEVEGDHYLVSRQRSSKGSGSTTLSFQRLTADGPQILDGKTATETQQRITALLHMTEELFRISAYGAQRYDLDFAEAMPGKRREVLGGIVIPEPEVWERRADAARQMGRDLQAQRDQQAINQTQAQARADSLPLILEQIAEIEAQLEKLGSLQSHAAEQSERFAAVRERLIGEQAADKAARAGLLETQQQLNSATVTLTVREGRATSIAEAVAGREAVALALAGAEDAASEAAEMEAARQERERLAGEGRTLTEQIKTAKAEHAAAVREIEQRIEAARSKHSLGLKARRDSIAQLAKQAGVLDSVPCAAAGNTPLVDTCPLVAQAREAREALPGQRRDLAWFETQTPWADDEKRLPELKARSPAADLIAQRDALKARHDALAYDADVHAVVKREAANLQKFQSDLAAIHAQAALLPQARQDLEAASAEADRLAEKVKELTAALGPEHDWLTELAAVDKRAAAAKAEQARLRSEIEAAQSARGRLTEQLAGAQAAAEDAQRLTVEIAEADRRLNLLRILGNPRDGAFSRGGIPALLVEEAIGELEGVANEVLQTLSDGQLAVELHSQRENKDGSLAEALDIIVHGPEGPRPFEAFSGGEAVRVALSVRAAISALLSRRRGARCEMLILDEPRWLDDPGLDGLVECLARLSDRFACILLATHIERLKEMFPCRIEVTKDAAGSRVEVITA